MENPKAQLLDKLKSANNILVTVSRDPSVDQLAALLGLTLVLNKQGKHAAAVFSGKVPSTIEFLKPEDTIETNTDSLRDFIIALDKSKADKLRYKVEDNLVRIFITPYKTSISEDDLEFTQGDFNVDVVVALGVQKQEDLDEAIVAHGRILHDATVASINTTAEGGLGTIVLHDPQASSLCELVTELAQNLGENTLDNQVATALLTGIVAETERFSNDKTSAHTMNASAALMSAGANQQLVAEKLEAPAPAAAPVAETKPGAASEPGMLDIEHIDGEAAPSDELPPVQEDPQPEAKPEPKKPEATNENLTPGPKLVTEPPVLGGTLTANTQPEGLDPTTDPFSISKHSAPLLGHDDVPAEAPALPATPEPKNSPEPVFSNTMPEPPKLAPQQDSQSQTLSDLEQAVESKHETPDEPLMDIKTPDISEMRSEVDKALLETPSPQAPKPIQALNAQPLMDNLNAPGAPSAASDLEISGAAPAATAYTPPPVSNSYAPTEAPSGAPQPPAGPAGNSAPPVPPPIPFQFGASGNGDQNPPL